MANLRSRVSLGVSSGSTILFARGSLYLWGGNVEGITVPFGSQEMLSSMDVFEIYTGEWKSRLTNGTPPLGVRGYSCAAVESSLYYFGGCDEMCKCYHNSVHELSTSPRLQWTMLSSSTSQNGFPMRKMNSGMVAFSDSEEDLLYVLAGHSDCIPSYRQHGARYEAVDSCILCNEQHLFSLSTNEWRSPVLTGQPPPPPYDKFSLSQLDKKRAVLYGGKDGSGVVCNDLLIVELTDRSVHWTKINKPVKRSLAWPKERCGHAAACLCENSLLLIIVGGSSDRQSAIGDSWIYNLTTLKWNKLPLPESVTKRVCHSIFALSLSQNSVLLVVYGGHDLYPKTDLINLIQGEDGQWLTGANMKDNEEYKQAVSEWREKQLTQMFRMCNRGFSGFQYDNARERERKLMRENQQLAKEVERITPENERLRRENRELMKVNTQLQLQIQSYADPATIQAQDMSLRERESLQTPINTCSLDDTPTIRMLKKIKGPDRLSVIDTIAAGDYEAFGMELLKDDNGQRIDLVTKDFSSVKATETILKQWLTGTIPDANPYPRTYHHLMMCLKEAGMGALADHMIRHYIKSS